MASSSSASDPQCARKLGNASWGVSAAGIIVTVVVIVIVVAVLVSTDSDCPAHFKYYVDGRCYRHRKRYGDSLFGYCDGRVSDGYCYYN